MTNAARSWESSVVELAQAGNLRAIAFWINRYLVPQGICAQVLSEQPGRLLIRVVCHKTPDCNQLVRFICHRLNSLNSEMIRSVRITAQLVGSPNLLWEQAARITPIAQKPSSQTAHQAVAAIHPLQVGQSSRQKSHQQPHQQVHQPSHQPFNQPNQPSRSGQPAAKVNVPITQRPGSPTPAPTSPHTASHPTQGGRPLDAIPAHAILNPPPTGVHPSAAVSPSGGVSAGSPHAETPLPNGQPVVPFRKKVRVKAKRLHPLVRWSRAATRQVITLPETTRHLANQSSTWFTAQTLPVRVLTVGGSAIAVFLIGCGFEVLRQYTIDPTLGQSSGLPLSLKPRANTVDTAIGQVPIVRPVVQDPENSAVTLIFSNSAALGQAEKPNTSEANLGGATQTPSGGIAQYQNADLIMTSLDNSLTLQQVLPSTDTMPSTTSPLDELSRSTLPLSEQMVTFDDSGIDNADLSDDLSDIDDGAEQSDGNDPDHDPNNNDPDNDLGNDPDRDRTSTLDSLSEDDDRPDESLRTDARLPKTTIHELMANGVDIVNLADNQTPEATTAELVQTLDVLKRSEIYSLGVGSNTDDARRPQVFEVKGQRIAYLAYSDPSLVSTLASASGITPPLSAQVVEDIQALREQVDWVVVSFRWQRNLRAYPEDWQVNLSRLAIDHGADLVVGYHPQLTQGAEIYQGRVIAYSLGSSLEEYVDEYHDEEMPDRDTVTLQVMLKDETMKLDFLPVQIRNGKARIAEGEEGTIILDSFQQASSFFEQPIKLPTVLDSRLRLSLPSAPDAGDLPTDPFLSYPESEQ